MRRLASTLEPIWLDDIAAQVLIGNRIVIHLEQQVSNADASARHLARALHTRHYIRLQRPAHSPDRQVTDLELRRVALASEAGVGVALRDVEGLLGVRDHEVAKGDVAEVA